MRILLVAENWPPRVGGIENYVTHIATGLGQSHEVFVLAPPGSSELDSAANVKVISKKFFWPVVKPAWLFLFFWVSSFVKKENIDFVLCGKGLFEGLIGYYLNKRLDIPYGVLTYAMEIETWVSTRRDKKKLTKVLADAQFVTYINSHTKQKLQELEVADTSLFELLPGVDDQYFTDVRESEISDTLQHYGVHRPYIICVSRLIGRKGVDILMEGFAGLDETKFSDVELVIVGDGPEARYLHRQAEQLYLNRERNGTVKGRVKFLSSVPDKDLLSLYAGAQMFALTPREVVEGGSKDIEGFGIVYLEAAAAGLPVLATKTGGVPGAVVDNVTGVLIDPEKSDEVTKQLVRLLTDKELRQRLGAAGRERANKDFRWTHVLGKLESQLSK